MYHLDISKIPTWHKKNQLGIQKNPIIYMHNYIQQKTQMKTCIQTLNMVKSISYNWGHVISHVRQANKQHWFVTTWQITCFSITNNHKSQDRILFIVISHICCDLQFLIIHLLIFNTSVLWKTYEDIIVGRSAYKIYFLHKYWLQFVYNTTPAINIQC